MLAIQELKEIRGFRDDLERRVHDLRLSRQVGYAVASKYSLNPRE